MPISPQQVAPPINLDRVGAFMADIDRQLSTPMIVSDAIVQADQEHHAKDLTSYRVNVMNKPLNVSELDYVSAQYVKAGWKECKVLEVGQDGGRGSHVKLILRAIDQVVSK